MKTRMNSIMAKILREINNTLKIMYHQCFISLVNQTLLEGILINGQEILQHQNKFIRKITIHNIVRTATNILRALKNLN